MRAIILCSGDSVLIQGSYISTEGTYMDSLLTINNCDSVIILTVSFHGSKFHKDSSNLKLAIIFMLTNMFILSVQDIINS